MPIVGTALAKSGRIPVPGSQVWEAKNYGEITINQ